MHFHTLLTAMFYLCRQFGWCVFVFVFPNIDRSEFAYFLMQHSALSWFHRSFSTLNSKGSFHVCNLNWWSFYVCRMITSSVFLVFIYISAWSLSISEDKFIQMALSSVASAEKTEGIMGHHQFNYCHVLKSFSLVTMNNVLWAMWLHSYYKG